MRHARPLTVLVAATAAVLLTGCAVGTGSAETRDITYDSDAAVSGSLSIMGFGAGDEVATARVDATEKLLDGVDVKLTEGDLDLQQFLSAVAAGDPPELLYADRDQIGSLAARGAILPLDDCIAGEGIDTGEFIESALDQVSFNGSVYGIPEFNQVQVIMANSELLDAAGLTLDDVNGSDWDAVTAANDALYTADGGNLSVIGFDSKLPEFLPLWAEANGGAVLSDDGKTAQLNSPEVVEALEWGVGIYDAQGGFGAVKAFRDSADFFGSGNQFATSTLGVMPMEQWYINVLNDVSPDAPLVFDTVRDTSGEPIAYAGGSAWAIPAGSDNPEAACRWARSMTSVDSWMAAADARIAVREEEGKPFTGILTGNTVADDQIRELVTSGGEPWDSGIAAMYEANDHTFTLPANPADAEFEDAMFGAVNKVLNGEASAQEALDQAQETAQKALDKAWSGMKR